MRRFVAEAAVVTIAIAFAGPRARADDAPLTASPPNLQKAAEVAVEQTSAPAGAMQVDPKAEQKGEPQAAKPSGPPKLEWVVGDYKVKIGGYVKLDAIHDFNQMGNSDSFDPRAIPVTPDPTLPDENTRLQAKQTRINLDVNGPFRVFVEGDFFGTGNAFRLRHAYGELKVGDDGKVLAGQTWTTFMDTEAMPETLDFESPIAFPQIRQALARYTSDLGGGSYWAIAMEDPQSDVLVPAGVTGATGELIPDIDAGINYAAEGYHVRLGLFGGAVRFEQQGGRTQNEPLWAANLATKVMTTGKDNAIAQVTYGNGAGRFRGGDVAAINGSGNLVGIKVIALMGSYQHYWSDEFRSTLVYSWAGGDPPENLPGDTTERLDYLAANFIWQFNPRAWTGIEYLHGSRESISHDYGGDHRLQLSIKFDI
jgi:outer membrane DcaP-like protein